MPINFVNKSNLVIIYFNRNKNTLKMYKFFRKIRLSESVHNITIKTIKGKIPIFSRNYLTEGERKCYAKFFDHHYNFMGIIHDLSHGDRWILHVSKILKRIAKRRWNVRNGLAKLLHRGDETYVGIGGKRITRRISHS